MLRREWLTLVLVVISLLVIAFSWGGLPEKLPMRWGLDGQPSAYGSKAFAIFFPIGIMIFVILRSLFWGQVHPENAQILRMMRLGISIVTLAISVTIALQWPNPRFMMIAVGIVFLLVGNLMGKTKPNYWIGVRLPWVFKSQRSWYATQRRGAVGLTVIGSIWALCSLVLPASILFSPITSSAFIVGILGLLVWLGYTSYQEYKNDPNPQAVPRSGAV